MPQTIRSFIALYPDPAALKAVSDFVGCLRNRDRTVRWEKDAHIHITMKFLGDVLLQDVRAVEKELRARLEGSGAVSALIDRVGGFPSLHRPRIIWLGLSDGADRVRTLNDILEQVCESVGMPREPRKFTPHFTIGRVRQQESGDLENALEACSFDSTPVSFDSMRIMQSTLTPKGAIHTVVADIPLQPGENNGGQHHQHKGHSHG